MNLKTSPYFFREIFFTYYRLSHPVPFPGKTRYQENGEQGIVPFYFYIKIMIHITEYSTEKCVR